MNENDEEILAELLIRWEELFEEGVDLSAIELAVDSPHLIGELERRIEGLKATSWLNEPLAIGNPFSKAQPSLKLTTLSGRYRLDELIAEGGFAQVWKAYDLELHRSVAVKLPKASRIDSTEAFLAEARRVARLNHPGIVTVHDVGIENGKCFIVSEFVQDGSLADYSAKNQITKELAIRWIIEIADALQFAHDKGIIHRDIKPPNILINHHGRALLADFGIAQSATKSGRFAPSIGTLRYMSPEQLDGQEVEPSSDVYSLGVLLYELIAKRSPYSTTEPSLLRREILLGGKKGLDVLPPDLKRICVKAMELEPSKRYQTAASMAEDLRKCDRNINGFIIAGALITLIIATFLAILFYRSTSGENKNQANKGVELFQINHDLEKVFSLDISPDGEKIVTGDVLSGLNIWNGNTGELISTLNGHKNWVRSVAFSPDAQFILSGSGGFIGKDGKPAVGDDNSVRLWDATTGKEIQKYENNKEPILSVQFSPDSNEILSAGDDDNVKLWDRRSGKLIHSMLGHWDDVHSAIFVPNSHFAVSGSEDGPIRLWDLDNGREIRSFIGHSGAVESLACTKDRKILVSAGKDSTIRIWNFDSGKGIRQFNGHLGEVNAIAISEDDHFLVGGGSDGIIRIWDIHSGEQVCVLEGHDRAVLCLVFSKDRQRVVSGGIDGTVRVWGLPKLSSSIPNKSLSINTDNLKSFEDYMKAGKELFQENEFDESVNLFSKAIEIQPMIAEAFFERAKGYFGGSNYKEGMADFKKALEIQPGNADFYMARASALSSISHFEEALADIQKAKLLMPARQKEFDRIKASIYADHAVKLSNGKNYAQAAIEVTKAMELVPGQNEYYHMRGKYFFNNKEYAKAAADFTEAIKIDPTNSQYYEHRAFCMHFLNRMEDKEADFRKVKELEYKP